MTEAPAQCPQCGEDDIVPILYGLLLMTPELERRRFAIGGCVMTGDGPEWHCVNCKREWRTSARQALDDR